MTSPAGPAAGEGPPGEDVPAGVSRPCRRPRRSAGPTSAEGGRCQAAFRPDARMWGYLGDAFVSAPIEGFLEVVAKIPDTSG